MSVRSLAKPDVEALAPLLKHAFAADPELRWVIPDATDWERISGPWFRMNLLEALYQGQGFTDDQTRGVSLWEAPGASRSLLSRLINLCRMALMFRGNLSRAIQIQAAVDCYRPATPYWYLTYIATHPRHQGTGIGGALLAPMLATADDQRCPVFLECSNERNIGFYREHGFEIVASVTLPGGPTIWPMLREAM